MGLLRFAVTAASQLPSDISTRAYFAGLDDIPWTTRVSFNGSELTLRRTASDSGTLHIPWRVPGFGELTLSTCTLIERDRPYHLDVELARGTLNRLRNDVSHWQMEGWSLPGHVDKALSVAQRHLALAATSPDDLQLASEHAELAIQTTLDAMLTLRPFFVELALAVRQREDARPTALLAAQLSEASPAGVLTNVASVFNTIVTPMSWREIESREGMRQWDPIDRQIDWAEQQGLRVCSGPLVQFDRRNTPDWLYALGGDDEAIRPFAVAQLRAAVERYRGRVHLWQCGAQFNVEGAVTLSEEQRLRLAAFSIEIVRKLDARTPVVLGIDQPCAEYMGHSEYDLSPLHFADALIRADLGLTGISLELNVGYWPGGTQPRDVLELSRHLDRWSNLGLPLLVSLSLPSRPDAHEKKGLKVLPYAGIVTPETQRVWLELFVPMIMSKPAVQGLVWNQLQDSPTAELPYGGLFDEQGQAKPALAFLEAARREFFG
jgi:hypothetical protein